MNDDKKLEDDKEIKIYFHLGTVMIFELETLQFDDSKYSKLINLLILLKRIYQQTTKNLLSLSFHSTNQNHSLQSPQYGKIHRSHWNSINFGHCLFDVKQS